jgi:hypothetical protein
LEVYEQLSVFCQLCGHSSDAIVFETMAQTQLILEQYKPEECCDSFVYLLKVVEQIRVKDVDALNAKSTLLIDTLTKAIGQIAWKSLENAGGAAVADLETVEFISYKIQDFCLRYNFANQDFYMSEALLELATYLYCMDSLRTGSSQHTEKLVSLLLQTHDLLCKKSVDDLKLTSAQLVEQLIHLLCLVNEFDEIDQSIKLNIIQRSIEVCFFRKENFNSTTKCFIDYLYAKIEVSENSADSALLLIDRCLLNLRKPELPQQESLKRGLLILKVEALESLGRYEESAEVQTELENLEE